MGVLCRDRSLQGCSEETAVLPGKQKTSSGTGSSDCQLRRAQTHVLSSAPLTQPLKQCSYSAHVAVHVVVTSLTLFSSSWFTLCSLLCITTPKCTLPRAVWSGCGVEIARDRNPLLSMPSCSCCYSSPVLLGRTKWCISNACKPAAWLPCPMVSIFCHMQIYSTLSLFAFWCVTVGATQNRLSVTTW